MPIYEFGDQYDFTSTLPGPRSSMPVGGATELNPAIQQYPAGINQISEIDGKSNLGGGWERDRVGVEDIVEWSQPAFHYLDEAMKLYWSDIRIPTKDSVRFAKTRVSGGNKSLQIWKDDLLHGRLKLPMIAINRGVHSYNSEKFSPAYHPMGKIFTGPDMRRVRKVFRPVPYLVEYTIEIWAETKRDAEHAIYQMMPRFNPLAEFRATDDHVVGTVQLRFGGVSDVSDKEVPAEQLAKIKYELSTTAEAWLSLPEQIVPTIINIYGGINSGTDIIPWDQINVVLNSNNASS